MTPGRSLRGAALVAFLTASGASAASGPTPVWDDCGFEPWDIVLDAPRAPVPPGSARPCASSSYFRLDCGDGPCVPLVHFPPMIHSRRTEVVDGKCVERGATAFVYCGTIIELKLLPPACPRPATSPREAIVTTPDGIVHIAGEELHLEMDADFSCGTFHCESDPATADDPTNPGQPLLCAPRARHCKSACELPPLAPFGL